VTDSEGNYAIPDMASGAYMLHTYQCGGFSALGPAYAAEYYHHAASEASATDVLVQAPGTTTIDESMLVGGRVTGQVIDASTGSPVAGIIVNANADDTSTGAGATTGPDGTFTIAGLFASDRYLISFYDPHGRYSTQWWDGKSSEGSADFVSVDFGATTAGINEALQSG
jgi:hypothetical protein